MTLFADIPQHVQAHVAQLDGPALDTTNPAEPTWRSGDNAVLIRPGSAPGTVALIGKKEGRVYQATSAPSEEFQRAAEIVVDMLRRGGSR